MPTGIKGFDEVVANLNKKIKEIETANLRGLVKAAILIRRDTERTPPLTPVDTGNLRASWAIVSTLGVNPDILSGHFKNNPSHNITAQEMASQYKLGVNEARLKVNSNRMPLVVMGYYANYTLYVHEHIAPPKSGEPKWSRPESGPKWFEAALTRNVDDILKIVVKESLIP
jgi:hypothetical protein